MPTVHAEFETKYDADDTLRVPGLVELMGEARARDGASDLGDGPWAEDDGAEHDLSATYFDTPDLRLTAAGLTLRRRTGGEDAGWHLKVPMADASRSEIRMPLEDGEATVPQRLQAMTHARTGGRPLVPVARVDTHRTVRHLVDPTGRVLLELADDRVRAQRLPLPGEAPVDGSGATAPGVESTWREVEVELVDGPPELLAVVDPVLREHGLRPAATASKLARALGREAVDGARRDHAARGRLEHADDPGTSAADVVLAHLGTQVEQIRAQDLPVRLDVDGAVHAMRVATRRLRSALTTFGPLLDRAVTKPVAGELKWLAGVLGEARDAEVMRERVTSAVSAEVTESGQDAPLTAVADDVSGRLDDAYSAAHEALTGHLDGERYRALLDALAALLEHPPTKKRAARPALSSLPELVAAADDEVRSAMRAAHHATDPDEREELLHDARKAAKRARYAAESVVGVFGKDARRFAVAIESVQEAVGEHLDSMNTRAQLRDLARRTTSTETAFTLGRLHAQEDVRVERSRSEVDGVWRAARKKDLRAWFR